MSEETSTDIEKKAAAAVAARRRTRKAGNEPPPLPTPDGLPEPVADPVHVTPSRVLVAGSLVAEFAAQVYTGLTGAIIPAGQIAGAGRQPLVQPMSNRYGTTPHLDNYVIAEASADESVVPPGCKTPVSRLLWQKGWRVRKDFYEAVMARTSPADQEAARLAPAKLPAGVTDPPPDMVTPAASPVIRPATGAPA